MKTPVEIIEETIEFYSRNPRSVDSDGNCKYLGPNEIKCAFSRCCKDDVDFSPYEGENCASLHDFLKEEYSTPTPWAFWRDLQCLHDKKDNWIEESPQASTRELSEEGKRNASFLKDRCEKRTFFE